MEAFIEFYQGQCTQVVSKLYERPVVCVRRCSFPTADVFHPGFCPAYGTVRWMFGCGCEILANRRFPE